MTCPVKSDLHIHLKQYDLLASSTGKAIPCDHDICNMFDQSDQDCSFGTNCEYTLVYGDESRTQGYVVRDFLKLDQVTGDFQTSAMNGSIAFGCSTKESGELSSSNEAVDGILGFGQANSSILSQLASAGKVKRVFSHCLDSNKGGGIFAIGEVVHPKVNRTKLVPNDKHYDIILKDVDVGGQFLNLPTDLFDVRSGRVATIDSGTTLAYLPSEFYQQLISKIIAQQPDLGTHIIKPMFKCFWYHGDVNDGFPVVTFHFEDSLHLPVYPNDYLFEVSDSEYCIGWQQGKDENEMILLGDFLLSNKLVVYDLESRTLGWTQYNCSSSIEVRDEASGNAYTMGSHDISSATGLSAVNFISFISLIAAPALVNLIA